MKINTYVLDTNFISSFLKVDDVNHNRALELFAEHLQDTSPIIPFIVKAELYYQREGSPDIKTISKFLATLDHQILYIDKRLDKEFKQFITHKGFKLKAPDALILFTAIYTKSELLTFDKRLMRAFKKLSN